MRPYRAATVGVFEENFTVQNNARLHPGWYGFAVRLGMEESGVTLVEYGLIVGVIGVGAIVAMTSLRGNIATLLSAVGNQLATSS